MLQPFFSKAAIRRVEFLITNEITTFLNKFHMAASEETPVNLSLGFRCLTADVVMSYTYQESLGAIDSPNFSLPLITVVEKFRTAPKRFQYFPRTMHLIRRIANRLPVDFTQRLLPGIAAYQELMRVRRLGCYSTSWADNHHQLCERRIQTIKSQPKNDSIPTIFDIVLNPDPERGQFRPSDEELAADAFLMFVAGTGTSANTLVAATWHALRDPAIEHKLVAELRHAMPDKEAMTDWQTLESLPYLVSLVRNSRHMFFHQLTH